MTQPNAVDAAHVKKSKLPRRDWILLPTLGVATILLLLSASEVSGRVYVHVVNDWLVYGVRRPDDGCAGRS